jgi:hypothetical protein
VNQYFQYIFFEITEFSVCSYCQSPYFYNYHSISAELHDGLRSIGRLDSVDQMNLHQKLYDFNARDDDEIRLFILAAPVM